MNPNDPANSGGNEPDDRLADELHHEAMAERPAFSAQLHRRVMSRIAEPAAMANPRSRFVVYRMPIAIAAGLAMMACAIAVLCAVESRRNVPQRAYTNFPVTLVSGQGSVPIGPASNAPVSLTIDVGGVISAQAWPPALVIQLPTIGRAAARVSQPAAIADARPSALLGSPNWFFDQLQQPPMSAQAALISLVPPDVRALARLATAQQ